MEQMLHERSCTVLNYHRRVGYDTKYEMRHVSVTIITCADFTSFADTKEVVGICKCSYTSVPYA